MPESCDRTGEAFGLRLSLLALFVLPPSAKQKRQKGQPHSKTLPRGREAVWNGRSFWTAPVFAGAFRPTSECKTKAAEGTAALQDAAAR
jgi:hypothetical protein